MKFRLPKSRCRRASEHRLLIKPRMQSLDRAPEFHNKACTITVPYGSHRREQLELAPLRETAPSFASLKIQNVARRFVIPSREFDRPMRCSQGECAD